MEGAQNNGGLEAFENFAWIMSDGCADYGRFTDARMSELLGAICVSPAVPEGNGKDVFMSAWDRNVNGQPDTYAFYAHDVCVRQTPPHPQSPPPVAPCPFQAEMTAVFAGCVGTCARDPRRPRGDGNPDESRGAGAVP